MKTAIKLILAAAVLGIVFPASALAADPDPQTLALYKSKCAACHGVDGKATAMGKKLNTRDFQDPEVVKMKDPEMIEVTAKGKGKMPGFAKSLKEDQIKSLVAYIRGLSAKK